jgi:hypothetical protein
MMRDIATAQSKLNNVKNLLINILFNPLKVKDTRRVKKVVNKKAFHSGRLLEATKNKTI